MGQYGGKRDSETMKKLKEDIDILEERIKDTIEKEQIMSIDLREIVYLIQKNLVINNKNCILDFNEKKELIETQYEKLTSIKIINRKKILKELIDKLKKTTKYRETFSF